ncbi:IS3 family transposase [Fictibacillus sp. B-59209]
MDSYIYRYNEERIQEKLGYLTPKSYGSLKGVLYVSHIAR